MQRLCWLIILLVLLVPIWWGADGKDPWDLDGIAPGPTLKAISTGFGPGWDAQHGPLQYPPASYYLIALTYVPTLALFKTTGELGSPSGTYPWGFSHPELSMGLLVILGRLVAVLAAIVIIRLAIADLRSRGIRCPSVIVGLLLIGSPVFVYYARTSNVDVHYMLWLWLGFVLVEHRPATLKRLAWAGSAAALAICTKEQCAPIAATILGAAVASAWRLQMAGKASGWRRALIPLLAAGVTYGIIWVLPLNQAAWRHHYDYLFHIARYPRDFAATPAGFASFAARLVGYFPAVLGWPAILGVISGLILSVRVRGLGLRWLALGLYFVFFLGSIGYVYSRFLLPALLVVVPTGCAGIGRALDLLSRRPARRTVSIALLAMSVLAGGPWLGLTMLTDPRYRAETWMKESLAPGTTVLLAGNPMFLPRVPRSMRVVYLKDRQGGIQGGDLPVDSVLLRSNLSPTDEDRNWEIARSFPAPSFANRFGLTIAPRIDVYRHVTRAITG